MTVMETSSIVVLNELAKETPYISNELKLILNQNVYEPNVFGVILSLLIVLALIYATSYFYQKLLRINAKLTKNNADGDLKEGINEFNVISGATLGQGKFLHVVEINDTYLVLGSTPNNITCLKEFSKKDFKKGDIESVKKN